MAGRDRTQAASAPAIAQTDGGFFVDASFGRMKADLGNTAGLTVDNKDTSFSAGGGYMFNRYIGAEIGYRDLGEVSASATLLTLNNAKISGNTVTGTLGLTVRGSSDGFYFGPVFNGAGS